MDGSSDTPPEVLVRRGLTAGVTVTLVSLIGWGASTIANVAGSILVAFGVDFGFLVPFYTHKGDLEFLVLSIVFLVASFILLFQRGQLYIEFAILIILGPLVAVSLVADDNPHPWAIWKREVIAICITPLLQLMLFLLFARVLGSAPDSQLSIGQWIGGFSLLALLWKMPRWARQFTVTTGSGHALANLGAGATRLAVVTYIARAAITKGL